MQQDNPWVTKRVVLHVLVVSALSTLSQGRNSSGESRNVAILSAAITQLCAPRSPITSCILAAASGAGESRSIDRCGSKTTKCRHTWASEEGDGVSDRISIAGQTNYR